MSTLNLLFPPFASLCFSLIIVQPPNPQAEKRTLATGVQPQTSRDNPNPSTCGNNVRIHTSPPVHIILSRFPTCTARMSLFLFLDRNRCDSQLYAMWVYMDGWNKADQPASQSARMFDMISSTRRCPRTTNQFVGKHVCSSSMARYP